MTKFTLYLLAMAVIACLGKAASAGHVQQQMQLLMGKPTYLVRVNLDSDTIQIRPLLAQGGVGCSETLASMANRGAKVVLTGAFFDTRSLQPMGDIVIDKKLVHFGGRGGALCLRRTKGGKGWIAAIRANDGIDRHTNWGRSEVVLAGGIPLLKNGEIVVNPKKSGFSPLLQKPDPRAGVGILKNGDLILVATKRAVTLTEWAQMLKAAGAVDALNYDGGSSTGLYMDGKALIAPGRKLTNALAVYVEHPPQKKQVALVKTKRPARRT